MDETPTVVVVEDNDDLRALYCLHLELDGHLVRDFRSAEEALATLPTIPQPLIILLDMRMPGMDGLEFFTALRANPALATAQVILLSGDTDTRGLTLPLLLKPVDEEALLREVRRHYTREPASRGRRRAT